MHSHCEKTRMNLSQKTENANFGHGGPYEDREMV